MMKRICRFSLFIVIMIAVMPVTVNAKGSSSSKSEKGRKYRLSYANRTISQGNSFKVSLKKGRKTVKAKNIRWKISDSTIAVIIKKNRHSIQIKGKSVGTATLRARYKGKTYKCKIRVKASSEKTDKKENPILNTSSVTLYYIDAYAVPYIKQHMSHAGSYQLTVSGTRYKVKSWEIEGDTRAKITFKVSDTGKVSMTGGYNYGMDSVKCRVAATLSDGTKLYADVTGIYEVTEYVKLKIAAFQSAWITAGMTEYQKMDAVAKYISSDYDYQLYQDNWLKMMVTGGGDCMASRVAVMMICRELGLHASACLNLDDHGETVVLADGKVYLVTTGYGGTKPREYDIRELTKEQFDTIRERNHLDPGYFGY